MKNNVQFIGYILIGTWSLSEQKKEKDNIIKYYGLKECPQKVEYTYITDELDQAEKMLKKYYSVREKMYGCNIIFEKYRNLVAIATFYEYFLSGRCVSLEGPQGAYNMYENEIRLNMINSQLSDVLKSLDEIKQNQMRVYSAINSMNVKLNKLNESMDTAINVLKDISINTNNMNIYLEQIETNARVTAYNSIKTAFYTQLNAEYTAALACLTALS